jgi:hypothetical protein
MSEPQKKSEKARQRRIYGLPAVGPAPLSGLAIASLALGVLAVALFWLPLFGQLISILAIVFGGLGIYYTNLGVRRGRGLAIAGLILGIVGLVLFGGFAAMFGALPPLSV